MNPNNKISYLPPSRNVIRMSFDDTSAHELYVENEKILRFKAMNEVDIIRTRCFYQHPSRETNKVVDGEVLRNEQDKIVESMKVMMAEYGVKKGIWKDINDAFRIGDLIENKRKRVLDS